MGTKHTRDDVLTILHEQLLEQSSGSGGKTRGADRMLRAVAANSHQFSTHDFELIIGGLAAIKDGWKAALHVRVCEGVQFVKSVLARVCNQGWRQRQQLQN